MGTQLREQIIGAATRRTLAQGWAGVTMGRLAEDVGVSRQTIYNEVGSKTRLAEALVQHELLVFLDHAVAAFTAEPDDLARAGRASALAVLLYAEQSPLIRAIVSSSQGAETDLLPLLTTRPSTILSAATATVCELLESYDLAVPRERVERTVDILVRGLISHIMYPTHGPEVTAEHLGWMTGTLLFAGAASGAR